MSIAQTQISVRGKLQSVPVTVVNASSITITGRWLRVAAVHDEDWQPASAMPDPELVILKLKNDRSADLFTFAQRLYEPNPKYQYPMEWDNAAVIPISTFADWWEKRLPQESRRNVRLAEKRGVTVRTVEFSDELVKGIKNIYDETPVRQGRPFWHYNKPIEAVRRENGTYPERSEFIGAFFHDELIGFIKLVYIDDIASVMQILSMNRHYDKRPTNALIAKAVELSVARSVRYLQYCKFVYRGNEDSPLTEFKRRNGFEPVRYPRFYALLSNLGRAAFATGAHHGISGMVPPKLAGILRDLRARFHQARYVRNGSASA